LYIKIVAPGPKNRHKQMGSRHGKEGMGWSQRLTMEDDMAQTLCSHYLPKCGWASITKTADTVWAVQVKCSLPIS
jgi:hypothetical protein